jgi:dihydrodipicolinate synthase/N-acetylneuraminate lyase
MFASPIDVPTIQRLSEECEKIVAIKDSSGDLPQMMRMIEAVRPNRPDFSFMTGWDSVLMPMLLIGCDGGTNATSGVVPEITRKLYDLTTKGQLDEARRVQHVLLRLFDAMLYSADFPEGFRVGVQLRGIQMGPGRQPLSDEHRAKLVKLRKTLARLLAEAELDGAATAATSVDSQQVNLIVEGVLAELRRRGVS